MLPTPLSAMHSYGPASSRDAEWSSKNEVLFLKVLVVLASKSRTDSVVHFTLDSSSGSPSIRQYRVASSSISTVIAVGASIICAPSEKKIN